jgi:hypothetical protein
LLNWNCIEAFLWSIRKIKLYSQVFSVVWVLCTIEVFVRIRWKYFYELFKNENLLSKFFCWLFWCFAPNWSVVSKANLTDFSAKMFDFYIIIHKTWLNCLKEFDSFSTFTCSFEIMCIFTLKLFEFFFNFEIRFDFDFKNQ